MNAPRVLRTCFAACLLFASLVGSACRPAPGALQYCTDAPCAAGLECVDGVCLPILPMPEPTPPCTSNDECEVDGNADGRECVEGECVWVECAIDIQCGSRICDDGLCAPRTLCVTDGDCKDGGICVDGTCRSPCEADEDCAQGLLAETCLEGRCRQTCLVDFLCFGGICEEGICEEAECAADGDCPMPNMACNGGRCEGYTPCTIDDDCFDPNFLCNEIGRCEPRPTCVTDAECGGGFLCIADVCRPATSCGTPADCTAGQECIAGRCVEPAGCRGDTDCDDGQVCAGAACTAVEPVTPAAVWVETAHGLCPPGGAGPCTLVLFAGETAPVYVGAVDEEGRPVHAALSAGASGGAIDVFLEGGRISVTGLLAGSAQVALDDDSGTAVHEALTVRVVDGASAAVLRVLVVDASTGAPVEGAEVTAGDLVEVADADGVASFATSPLPDAVGVEGLTAIAPGYGGVVVLGLPLAGNLRVLLDPVPSSSGEATGVSGRVLSSGDEVGPVGYGVGLVGQAGVNDASLRRLFGPAYVGSLEAPLVGAIDVALPAAVTLEATVPLVMQNQVVRDRFFAESSPGWRTVTGFELRREVGDLLGSIFGAGELDLALNLAELAEGMDVLVDVAGLLQPLPRVADELDVDGDGDVTESVPDWASLPSVEVVPSQKPRERVGLVATDPPTQARARLFAVGGLLAPAFGFIPTGMATLGGGGGTEQLRVAPPQVGLTASRRAARVEAVFDDEARSSALLFVGEAFAADLDLGSFLAPPEGSFVLDDVPVPGGHTLFLASSPGATTYVADLDAVSGRYRIVVPSIGPGGRSVPLPATLAGALATVEVISLRRPGASNDDATAALVVAGSGPVGDVRNGAAAVASVREALAGDGP